MLIADKPRQKTATTMQRTGVDTSDITDNGISSEPGGPPPPPPPPLSTSGSGFNLGNFMAAPPAPPAPPTRPVDPTPGQGIAPTLGTVSDDMLVEKRLPRLLADGNPYVEQASARAVQLANARGMQNSSLAAMSGTEAAINAALPIASQDATTFGRVQADNLGYQNQFGMADKNASLQSYLQARDEDLRRQLSSDQLAAENARTNSQGTIAMAEIAARERLADKEFAGRERLANLDLAAREREAATQRQFQERMQGLGFQNQRELDQMKLDWQTQQNLLQMNQNTFSSWASGMNNIMTNTNMSKEDRERFMNNWTSMFAPNPYFPYRPATGAYTPAPPPPPPAPPPPPPPSDASGFFNQRANP